MWEDAEWLEADGLGGYASGPVLGARTRRYHALLLAATDPPGGRMVLVNGVAASVTRAGAEQALDTQLYAPDVVQPDGWRRMTGFAAKPWPCWRFDVGDGASVIHEILVAPDTCETVLRWRVDGGAGPCLLSVRPLLTGRDYHALHHENPAFDFSATVQDGRVSWRPYASLPAVAALTGGTYRHDPLWFRNALYAEEQARGMDCTEDLASPGAFLFDLAVGDAVMILRAGDGLFARPAAHARALIAAERTRRAAATPLDVAADSYLVDRTGGRTILAGFPWFTDWGRDTFIAMRGLLLARARFAEAGAILSAWAGLVSEGMVPNRFADSGPPEFNAVDASLWFVIAAHEFAAASGTPHPRLRDASEAILTGYAAGTRFAIRADDDGLLAAGVPGTQLTWMDAKVGDWVVTPRIGKPVEVQALWINALRIGAGWNDRWAVLADRAHAAFLARFPDPETGGLFDVVDVDHAPGTHDGRIRPNQIFAVGGLPLALLDGAPARRVVRLVEQRLLTPLGLRTLDPGDPDYQPRYIGDVRTRDGAYHQGTVWPWLMGPFVEAWLRVAEDRKAAMDEARARFLPPLIVHLDQAGLGHVSEIADGDAPHTPRGCPFQAWSLGEMIRIEAMLTQTVE